MKLIATDPIYLDNKRVEPGQEVEVKDDKLSKSLIDSGLAKKAGTKDTNQQTGDITNKG